MIYTLDHEPAQVHITGPGQAKVDIAGAGGPTLVWSIGIKRADMRRLMREVRDRRVAFLAEWEAMHGPDD